MRRARFWAGSSQNDPMQEMTVIPNTHANAILCHSELVSESRSSFLVKGQEVEWGVSLWRLANAQFRMSASGAEVTSGIGSCFQILRDFIFIVLMADPVNSFLCRAVASCQFQVASTRTAARLQAENPLSAVMVVIRWPFKSKNPFAEKSSRESALPRRSLRSRKGESRQVEPDSPAFADWLLDAFNNSFWKSCHPVMLLYGISLFLDSRPQTLDPS